LKPEGQQVRPQQKLPMVQQTPSQHLPIGQQLPPQLLRPGGQVQVPSWQTPLVHLLPQAPQLFGSVAGLMQVPPQHNHPAGQDRSQPPQSVSEEEKFVHLPEQQSPPGQQGSVYVLEVQSTPPPGMLWQHTVVQSDVQSDLHGLWVVVHWKPAGPGGTKPLNAVGVTVPRNRKAGLAVTRRVGSLPRTTTVSVSGRGRVRIAADLRSQPERAGLVQS
jgi:hypothetical protein